MTSFTELSSSSLRRAADLKEQIEALQNELNQILGAASAEPVATYAVGAPKKRVFSAASRAKMAQAQRARWARVMGGATTEGITAAPKKRRLSAQGLANIRAGVAKRMAMQGRKTAVSYGKPKIARSAAWRAAISAAAKARWAKARAAGRTRL